MPHINYNESEGIGGRTQTYSLSSAYNNKYYVPDIISREVIIIVMWISVKMLCYNYPPYIE